MKNGLKDIVGRRIRQVVVASNDGPGPGQQVFFIFDDGTYFEFYGEDFNCTACVDRGGASEVMIHAHRVGAKIVASHCSQNAEPAFRSLAERRLLA